MDGPNAYNRQAVHFLIICTYYLLIIWHATQEQDTLSEDDLDQIKGFALRIHDHLSRRGYNAMRKLYNRKLDLHSEYIMFRRMEYLSGVQPVLFDCCINSCVAFTGDHEDLDKCPIRKCGEPRYALNGRARKQFSYIPLIPRLCGLYKNAMSAERMLYRSRCEHIPREISDVFDSVHYRQLCDDSVIVDGIKLNHKFFSDPRDIALGFSTDGFTLFKSRHRGTSTAWPLLVVNYNLSPEIRTHSENLISLGVIPGPYQPKDFDSFLFPFVEECIELARGVRAYDGLSGEQFTLHAYPIQPFGDIPAMSKLMKAKGHNAFAPCRCCNIKAVLDDVSGVYYVPLNLPRDNGQPPKAWDPENLPLRDHVDFSGFDDALQRFRFQYERDEYRTYHGINGTSILCRVPSFDFGHSFQYELMHLIFENFAPNLVDHWTGRFKNLDEGSERYVIDAKIWEIIGKETSASSDTVPAAFVSKLPDIAADRHLFKAEHWSFWILFIAPIVLRGRFQAPKYYHHICQLARIIKQCLQFTITISELDQMEQDMIDWVQNYERYVVVHNSLHPPERLCHYSTNRYYYQYRSDRLCACPITIHALLHLAHSIRMCGPVWTWWTFVMERHCNTILQSVKSRTQEYACIDQFCKRSAQLQQIISQYGLFKELSMKEAKPELSSVETVYAECKCINLSLVSCGFPEYFSL